MKGGAIRKRKYKTWNKSECKVEKRCPGCTSWPSTCESEGGLLTGRADLPKRHSDYLTPLI